MAGRPRKATAAPKVAAGRVLAATVILEGDSGNPAVVLLAGETLPEQYADRVTNPAAFVEVKAADEAPEAD